MMKTPIQEMEKNIARMKRDLIWMTFAMLIVFVLGIVGLVLIIVSR